jgi:hypothetical protein
VIRKDSPQAHGTGVQDGLVAQTAQASMSMDYFDALTYYNISENGKEGENGGKRRLAIDDEKWDVVDLEAICKVSYTSPTSIGMGDDNNLVAAINEFLQRG